VGEAVRISRCRKCKAAIFLRDRNTISEQNSGYLLFVERTKHADVAYSLWKAIDRSRTCLLLVFGLDVGSCMYVYYGWFVVYVL
jgi:hypothetical protein